MNKAIKTINEALIARRMLPMDGYCSCSACGRKDLDRDEVKGNYCLACLDDADSYCSESLAYRDYEAIETAYDYVRGKRVEI